MRRIIGAAFALALTACAEPADAPSTDAAAPASADAGADPDVRAPAAATSSAADAASGPAVGSPVGGGATARAQPDVILFLGTSLTAGYGLGADLAYPALIQEKLDSAGLPFRASNAGISGETSAGGLRRIDWALQAPIAVLVLELGANDGLRGLEPARMRANLDEILRRTRERYPDADLLVLGMEAPPNLGERYTTRFRNVFSELAEKYDAPLVPFFLQGVAGVPALNQADGIHPTAEGQRRIAETVWRALVPILETRNAAR